MNAEELPGIPPVAWLPDGTGFNAPATVEWRCALYEHAAHLEEHLHIASRRGWTLYQILPGLVVHYRYNMSEDE